MQAKLPDPYTPENWLRYARSDLTLAQSIAVLPDVLLDTFCFHAQQAAEKSLKAVLLRHNLNFPYTHDLSTLVTLIEKADIPWEVTLNSVVDLTRYAVAGRYPNEIEAPTLDEYHEAIAIAAQVLAWAQTLIAQTLSEESP